MNINWNTKRTLLFAFCLLSVIAKGQAPLLSFYKYNENYLNPAFAGVRHDFEITSTVHKQYMDKAVSPSLIYVDVNGVLSQNHNIAGGLTYSQERIGVFSEHSFGAAFAYRIRVRDNYGKKDYISFGLRPEFEIGHVAAGQLYAKDDGDPLNADFNGNKSIRFSTGMTLVSPNYYVGISALNFGSVVLEEDISNHKLPKTPSFVLNGGYYHRLGNELDLHLFGHSTYNTSFQYGAQAVVVVKKTLLGGLNIRTSDHIGAMAGVRISIKEGPQQLTNTSFLKLLYGVELKRLKYNSPVLYHEIVLSYVLERAKRKDKCNCNWSY